MLAATAAGFDYIRDMAVIATSAISLVSGRRVTLRSAVPGDGAAFNAFIRNSFLADPFLVRKPEEYSATARDERKRLRRTMAAPDEIILLAESDDGKTMVGLITTRVDRRQRARHNIEVGIAIHQDWRGDGLGCALMEMLIKWGEGVETLRRMELHVLADNVAARHLYEALGFEPEGQRNGAIRQDDGRYVDDIIMCRWVGGDKDVRDGSLLDVKT